MSSIVSPLTRSEATEKYRTIFDLANDAIFLHDAATGAILDINQRAEELYGYTREEAVRLTVADLSAGPTDATQAAARARLRATAAGTPQLFEWEARDRGGRTFWVEVNLKQVIIDGRQQLLAVVRDISERKRHERAIYESHESQRALNALLQLALEGMTLDDLLVRALSLLLHNPWPGSVRRGAVYLYDAAGELVLETELGLHEYRTDAVGEPYRIPIHAGSAKLGILMVYADRELLLDSAERALFEAFASTLAGIIVRKRGEDSLMRADEQIREQAALVWLGEMAAVVAHEVRNPLAGIRGAIQIIGSRLTPGGHDAEVVREVLSRVDALNDLMTDLLLFARPPQAERVPIDIFSLARETSEFVAQDDAARDIRFVVEGRSASVNADPKLLRSVLLNVLINAAHAVQGSGIVRTSVDSTETSCIVTVSDTGPGIAPEIRDRIFVPFFTTKTRGTGLGLPTAKRLVEAHRGRIRVSCPLTGGTTVSIELPR